MIANEQNSTKPIIDDDNKNLNEIDELIKKATDKQSFDLRCPSRNDDKPCPHILNLSRQLIKYKRWLHTIYKKSKGNDGIKKTIKIDIARYVQDEIYKNVFKQAIAEEQKLNKINKDQAKSLQTLIDSNVAEIGRIKKFMELERRGFIKLIKTQTKILPGQSVRIYRLL